jgi:hypothetical protein
MHLIPTHIKDCFEVKEKMEQLGQLPEGTRLFTMDATSMYTNIDTDHGLHILEQFFEMNKDKLPAGFPTKLVLEAVKIVMRFNVFEFDGTIIKQLTGTAMGTPMACTYSMIYYAYHEISTLLHKYRRHLLYYKRFIDDGCGLWNDLDDPSAWDSFRKDVDDFGKLRWEVEERSREVNFLDLTITINDSNRIETRTYQKPMNLYLYLHHASAHPPGVLKGMIYGCMRRYYLQNSHRPDYLMMIRLLRDRLVARGHNRALLNDMMVEAAQKIEFGQHNQIQEEIDSNERTFLHVQYHPNGISRRQLREAFDDTCNMFTGTEAAIKQVTVAFSRPPNLKDKLTSAKLREVAGKEVSTIQP